MLNYTNTRIFFMILLLVSISLDSIYDLPALIYLGLYLLYSALFFYGVFSITSHFFIPVICSAQTSNKVVSLSFDDGPSEYTLEIIQILQDYRIKAAFFCIGKHLSANASTLQRLHQHGHLIGNHSYSHHLLFDLFLSKAMLDDLQKMDAALYELIGLKPRLFRPPYGVINPCLKKAIVKGNYIPIGWNVRSLDTIINDEQKLLNKLMSALKPGAIFLFHDTQQTTRAILPAFIEHVLANGYQISRLDDMLNIPAYKNS